MNRPALNEIKQSIAEKLPVNTYYWDPPSSYIFPGAEVFLDDDSKNDGITNDVDYDDDDDDDDDDFTGDFSTTCDESVSTFDDNIKRKNNSDNDENDDYPIKRNKFSSIS